MPPDYARLVRVNKIPLSDGVVIATSEEQVTIHVHTCH